MNTVIVFTVETHEAISGPPSASGARTSVPSAVTFVFTRANGAMLGVVELRPLPSRDVAMLTQLGAALAFGLAANLAWSSPDIRGITIRTPGPLHAAWGAITETYEALTGVRIAYAAPPLAGSVGGPQGDVFLLTGGKDTLWTLDRYARGRRDRPPALYLALGAELNWRKEIPQVLTRASSFGLDLTVFEVMAMYNSATPVLRFANRATWRELLTLSLARCYGSRLYTGINIDAVARLDVRAPHFAILLSQLVPVLEALERILGATIVTVPGEFEVYRDIRDHPLRADSGSCLSPACATGRRCAKCEGFAIYDALLDGWPLTPAQRAFIESDRFLGDAALLESAGPTTHDAERFQAEGLRRGL